MSTVWIRLVLCACVGLNVTAQPIDLHHHTDHPHDDQTETEVRFCLQVEKLWICECAFT